jgi:hypothetical protein
VNKNNQILRGRKSMKPFAMPSHNSRPSKAPAVLAFAAMALLSFFSGTACAQSCARTVTADVIALDQPFFWNRLGAAEPQGMMFALRRDIVPIDAALGLTPGNVRLRDDKRPRPLVLRMNAGDCLQIKRVRLF